MTKDRPPDFELWEYVKTTVTPPGKATRATPTSRDPPLPKIIDLHGYTHDVAYEALLAFLEAAYHQGYKQVRVITGVGRAQDQERRLQQVVPRWLETPAFIRYVNTFRCAPRRQGGQGALIVTLKKLMT